MLFAVLSILDAMAAALLVGGHFGLVHVPLLYTGLYLGTKIFFWRDLFSLIDLCAALYCIFVFFGHAGVLTWIFVGYFLYKFAIFAYSSASG